MTDGTQLALDRSLSIRTVGGERAGGGGFMCMGRVGAVGIYDVSRRLERGKRATLGDAVVAWRANVGQIATMGVVLMLFLLAWIRIAFLVFALFFGASPPSWDLLI